MNFSSFQLLSQTVLELDARTANYCETADAESKREKERTEELLQELKTLEDQLGPGGSTSLLALEEENCRLHNQLKAAKQDKKVTISVSKENFCDAGFQSRKMSKKQMATVNLCHNVLGQTVLPFCSFSFYLQGTSLSSCL